MLSERKTKMAVEMTEADRELRASEVRRRQKITALKRREQEAHDVKNRILHRKIQRRSELRRKREEERAQAQEEAEMARRKATPTFRYIDSIRNRDHPLTLLLVPDFPCDRVFQSFGAYSDSKSFASSSTALKDVDDGIAARSQVKQVTFQDPVFREPWPNSLHEEYIASL